MKRLERCLGKRGWACVFLAVFMLLFGLGSMRLYAIHLENKLSLLVRQIEKAQEDQLLLQQELAALLSPSRVYSNAHAKLGMGYANQIWVCRVTPEEAVRGVEEAPISLWRRFAVFVGREASAGN